jgi:23S rRNA (pseudouridine1915-N3)-methyltransferase
MKLDMKLILASISPRKSRAKSPAADVLFEEFLARIVRYTPAEAAIFDTETSLLAATQRDAARKPNQPAAALILCDSTGENLTSEQFAEAIRQLRDNATQRLMLGIGPADGWSATARARATRTVAFGRITLPHELARAVMAEQVYRALTILANHPYHSGH